jgi:hypothetical protein
MIGLVDIHSMLCADEQDSESIGAGKGKSDMTFYS